MITRIGVPSRVNKANSGFTLIELLLVVAIIGLLAAIAIPQFIAYRTRAIDTQMKSDLKNAAMAMESYFAEFKIYPASVGSISSAGLQANHRYRRLLSLLRRRLRLRSRRALPMDPSRVLHTTAPPARSIDYRQKFVFVADSLSLTLTGVKHDSSPSLLSTGEE